MNQTCYRMSERMISICGGVHSLNVEQLECGKNV